LPIFAAGRYVFSVLQVRAGSREDSGPFGLAYGMLIAQRVLFFAIRGAPRPWPEGRVLAWTSAEEAGHAAAGAGRFPRLVIGSVKVCVVGAGLVKVFVSL
jgi:hypothetical protein